MALVETLMALPLLVLFACLWVQVLWLFWAGQTLAVSTSYALRAGALQHGERPAIERTLAAGMATIDPAVLNDLDGNAEDKFKLHDRQSAHLVAAARQQLHLKWAARVQIRHATPLQLRKFGVQRRVRGALHWVMPNDHLEARALQFTAEQQQDWLLAQLLELEVWWCLPLQIPLAAQLLAGISKWGASPAQQFCNARAAIAQTYYWGLTYRVEGPMLSDLIGSQVSSRG